MNKKHIGSDAKDMIKDWCKKDKTMRKAINKAMKKKFMLYGRKQII